MPAGSHLAKQAYPLLIHFFILIPSDLYIKVAKQNGHQWADQVKKGIGQVG